MPRMPQTDSITELARFWDTHDVTEFDEELDEVPPVVFDRGSATILQLPLDREEAEALHRMAQSRGMKEADLVKTWVSEKVHAS